MRKPVLFNFEQVLELTKSYQKMHKSKDMSDYEMGVVEGIDFVFFLYDRCEK